MLAAITSMLVVGLSMVPVMQNSFAHKKSSEDRQAGGNTNTNTNTNSADSSSSSSATASNTNNITNSATATQSQGQDVCAVAVTCPEGSTTVTVGPPSPPPADPCPHSPYTDFSGGLCLNDEPTITCSPDKVAGQPATPTSPQTTPPTCTATQDGANQGQFISACNDIPGGKISGTGQQPRTCTFPAKQTCPPAADTGEIGTVDPVSGRCAIQPETT
jgi:hypothetical protein